MIFDLKETSADGMRGLVAAVYDRRCECAALRRATPKLLRGGRTAAMGCACEDHGPRQSQRDRVRGRVRENAGGAVAADCIRHARPGYSGAVSFESQEEEPLIARITRMNLDASSNQHHKRHPRFSIFLPCVRDAFHSSPAGRQQAGSPSFKHEILNPKGRFRPPLRDSQHLPSATLHLLTFHS